MDLAQFMTRMDSVECDMTKMNGKMSAGFHHKNHGCGRSGSLPMGRISPDILMPYGSTVAHNRCWPKKLLAGYANAKNDLRNPSKHGG